MHSVRSPCDRIYPFRVARGKPFLKFPLQFLGSPTHKYRLSAKSLQDIGFGFRVFHHQQAYSLVHGHSCLFIRSKLEGLLLEEDVIRGQKHATWSEIVPAEPIGFLVDLDAIGCRRSIPDPSTSRRNNNGESPARRASRRRTTSGPH